MLDQDLNLLIMAGGQGTRFWPESLKSKPKQYLSLTSEDSLLTDTLKRFKGLIDIKKRFIVTVKEQAENVHDCLMNEAISENIIYEPEGRNTAPCILLSLAKLLHNGASKDDIFLVVPSDHVILNTKGFQETINIATQEAKQNNTIVTIGINPNFPNTGFGYIHKGNSQSKGIFDVQAFKEKPSKEKAIEYLSTGEYFWNAGMFLGRIGVFLNEFKEHAPNTYKHFDNLYKCLDNFNELSAAYSKIPKDSIDYAIMEKSKIVKVTAALFDWNDLGSWDALEAVVLKVDSNTVVKDSDHFFENASGNIIYAPDKFVSLIDVNNLIVVSNNKNVMILPKTSAQKVKNIVQYLKEHKSELL